MLQDQYEKHNLEMQPYCHYLAEYQNMRPEEIGRIWKSHLIKAPGFFMSNLWRKITRSAIRSWRFIVWMNRMSMPFYAMISMRKY